ncbi:DUF4238 domain-containing protein [Alteromonas sp. KUL49]|uniref:DUF4238 domain-containing protein n=1 Tax=Alteromonas sp. KUL49 TaxID=2480798 RepID=UPI00102F1A03|nr:DUF4238 domain-containing protein [Alteromonas sp. KUL49]TAP41255.1 DUF4238 domain-containing protein [Alteromonas sp. KUL49]GEA10309.1 hypothetical protein KUL49_06840 [Alteromonas sp. KUL49]
MATNKNQHYVPKCYLKEFTLDSLGKAINVYNVDRSKLLRNAPVKNQCSGNYFYGKSAKLEGAIQLVERAYATTLRELLNSSRKLTDKHRIILIRFWLLQHLRTEAASRRTAEMFAEIGTTSGIDPREFNLEIKEAVILAMKQYAECMSGIDDLKTCIVYNKTKLPFITSDDPAVLTNKWYINDERTKFRSFGVGNAGALTFLPLTPKLLFLGYDGDVYNVSNKNGWTSISSQNDVISFNQQQILNCRANIFLKDAEHECFLKTSVESISKYKPETRHRVTYAVPDYNDGEYTRYRVVENKEAEEHQEVLMHSEVIHPKEFSWPSVIKYRSNGKVFTNGTGKGYMRRYHIPPGAQDYYWELSKPK